MSRYNRGETPISIVFGTIAFVIAVLSLVVKPIAYSMSADIVSNVTIQAAERGNGDKSNHLVFTDKGQFEFSDTLMFGDWRSSDRYAEVSQALREGRTFCRFKTAGWRWGFFSYYPNILESSCVEPPA